MSEQKKHVHAGHVFIWAAGICAKSRSNKNIPQKSWVFLLHVWSWMVFFRWFGSFSMNVWSVFVPVELAGPLGAWLSPTHGASPSPSPKDHPNGSPKSSLSSPKRRAFLEPDTAQVHILQAPWGLCSKISLISPRKIPPWKIPLEDTVSLKRILGGIWWFFSGGVGGKSGVSSQGMWAKSWIFLRKRWRDTTVDGRNPAPVDSVVNILLIYKRVAIYPRWLFGISSINSMTWDTWERYLISRSVSKLTQLIC